MANAGHVSLAQLRVMTAIEICRTAALGGHVERCEDCAHTRIAYNSCRNRHCPKCQWSAAEEWLAAREAELLPVPYFHVVFTLPAADRRHRLPEQGQGLRPTVHGGGRDAHHDRRRSASTSAPRSASPRCCTPGDRTSTTTRTSIASCPAAASRRMARAGFPAGQASSCRSGCSHGCSGACSSTVFKRCSRRESCSSSPISSVSSIATAFGAYLAPLRTTEWVVYAKRPFAGPSQVLAYLARYTHRVAIGNSRLVDLDDEHVSFRWKDYRQNGAVRPRSCAWPSASSSAVS